MARAKLSGSLLACKATPAAQIVSATRLDADEKALGRPALVWSAHPPNQAETNATGDVGYTAVAPQPTDLDHAPAPRRTVFRAVAIAVSVLAMGSVSGLLLLQPSGGNTVAETVRSTAASTATEKLASGGAESELQPPAKAAAVVPSQGASDSSVANAAPTALAPEEAPPDPSSTEASHTARIVAPTDPAFPGDASPPVSKSVGGTPSTAPTEPPGSAALNSALLARGDALFVTGDVNAARLFYERAANAGHGQAALQLGETFDPAFLARTGFIGALANVGMAARWYQRARELGISEADMLLRAMGARPDSVVTQPSPHPGGMRLTTDRSSGIEPARPGRR
jgi:hypothetical protein